MAPRPIRHSGLQKQVLSLYRECLRKVIQLSSSSSSLSSSSSSSSSSIASSTIVSSPSSSFSSTVTPTIPTDNPSNTTTGGITWYTNDGVQYIRQEFRTKARTVDKLDIQRIEFLIRQGKKRLEILNMANVQNITGITNIRKEDR